MIERDIIPVSYNPLDKIESQPQEVLNSIATKHDLTEAQVTMKWL